MTHADYHCWCGADALVHFSDDYRKCTSCNTLVSTNRLPSNLYEVHDDESDYYGKKYWFQHQTGDLKLPDIETRAEADLSSRCIWWLKELLKYKLPGASALDLGCAHGGFVFLLKQAGFKASGLELSQSIVDFASTKFGVSVHCGAIDTLDAEQTSFDVICLLDVFEHLTDPVGTLRKCADLLEPGGVFIIQCPRYDGVSSYEQLQQTDSAFLKMLIPEEHLFLFTMEGAQELFRRIGFPCVTELPAYFSEHDMFFLVSKEKPQIHDQATIASSFRTVGGFNPLQVSLRLFEEKRKLEADLESVNKDRAQRLERVQELAAEIDIINADRAERLRMIDLLTADIKGFTETIEVVNDDRQQRLRTIDLLTAENNSMAKLVEIVNKDRADRLEVIESLSCEVQSTLKKLAEVIAAKDAADTKITELEALLSRSTRT